MVDRVAAIVAAAIVIGSAGQALDLPPSDTFLRAARAKFTESQAVWPHYAYKERRTDLHMNPFGRMGTGGTRVFEVRPSPNPRLTFRRMIERDGAPVSQEELRRQDLELQARLARASQDDDAGRIERRRGDDMLAKRRAQMIVDDVVNVLRFELVRREFHNSRPVIVVSFAARPDVRPLTREGEMARVFRGHLWIDEASHEITDVRAIATDSISFGSFIAKIYEGTEAVVERREIEAGVWMPTRLTFSGEVRALFRRARIDHVVEWFDYRAIQGR